MVLYGSGDARARANGYSYRSAAGKGGWSGRTLIVNSWRCAPANGAMLADCAAGHPLAYLLWPVARPTTCMLFSRMPAFHRWLRAQGACERAALRACRPGTGSCRLRR